MPTFAIQQGPTALCTWDLDSGGTAFHPRAIQRDGMLVLEETKKLAFVLSPAPAGAEQRILIGDIPLNDLVTSPEDASGVALAGQLFWRELPYFESARGLTRIIVESRPLDSSTDPWRVILSTEVCVLPSKLGEDRYHRMTDDLQELSRSLLVDLYGKSTQTHDVRFVKECQAYQSREQELSSIEMVVERLAVLLDAIGQRPASRVRTVPCQQRYWGGERLTPAAIAAICRRGTPLRAIEGPVLIPGRRKVESFDIGEHRVIRAFLEIVMRRAAYCAEVARGHIRAITSEQHLRHIRLGTGPTLYESVDLPRIRRLNEAIQKSDRAVSTARTLAELPFLRDARPELVAIQGGVFQRSPEYQALLSVIRRFLMTNAVWYEGDEMSAVTKLTSRLFEQWCYLRIVEAFRNCGLELREWTAVLRDNLRSRFILDFDRGLTFEGMLTPDLRLRLRYEPWILGEDSAVKAKETLCRGSSSDVAWCPDIVIECLITDADKLRPVYGIVLDCKYTTRIRNQHWSDTSKYLEIRSTEAKRQVVRQLWLVAPSDEGGIKSEDPAVHFGDGGPSCASDEAVRFSLAVVPSGHDADHSDRVDVRDPFHQFAHGTISFVRREFGRLKAK